MSIDPRRRRTAPLRLLACLVICLLGAAGPSAATADVAQRSWFLTNNFACISTPTGMSCGPHMQMAEGNGNGVVPSGFIQVADGVGRVWFAPPISPAPTDYANSVWSLDVGGTSVVTRFTWTVGIWDPAASTFIAAPGPETTVTGTGRTTFAPQGPFAVPGHGTLALRVTGSGGTSLFDVYDEAGGDSPISLTAADRPGGPTAAPPTSAVDKQLCDNGLATPCGYQWAQRHDGPGKGFDMGTDVAVSPDGSRVFVTGASAQVRPQTDYSEYDWVTFAYDARTGAQLWSTPMAGAGGSDDIAAAAVVSPDGRTLFVTGSTCVVTATFYCSSDTDYLTVAYDTTTGAERWRAAYGGPAAREDEPTDLSISPDGTLLAVTGTNYSPATDYDYATVAYDAATGEQRWLVRADGGVSGPDAAADLVVGGSVVYVTGAAATTAITGGFGRDYLTEAYDSGSGALRWRHPHDGLWSGDDIPAGLALSPDGNRLFVAGREEEDVLSSDAATVALDAATGALQWVARSSGAGRHNDLVEDIAAAPDGHSVAITVMSFSGFPYRTGNYATLRLEAATGATTWSARYDGPGGDEDHPLAVALSPDSRHAYVTGLSAGAGAATAPNYDMATIGYELPD